MALSLVLLMGAGVMLRNLENKGNPWGMADKGREEWLDSLDFSVRRAIPGTALDVDIEYLFWVGCAGALEDRAKKTTKAIATLLHQVQARHTLGFAFEFFGGNAEQLAEHAGSAIGGLLNVTFAFAVLGIPPILTNAYAAVDSVDRGAGKARGPLFTSTGERAEA